MHRRRQGLAVALVAALVLGQAPASLGYENNQSGTTVGGGAHRKINQMAGALFAQEIVKGPQSAAFRRYDFQPLSPATKYRIIGLNDDVSAEDVAAVFTATGVTTSARMGWRDAEFDAAQKDVAYKFSGWVIEGGFTADEPERFMSLRHFNNPLTDLGPAYLTDIPRGGSLVMGDNPGIDAVSWATTDTDNPYNWSEGVRALRAALSGDTLEFAQRDYAHAWRSLGETMHLVADMSVPAHVRNDSHPGDWRGAAVVADLRADAYEYLTNWGGEVERGWTARIMDPGMLSTIRAAETPDGLMRSIAAFVNSHFFSSDTIPYPDRNGKLTAFNVGGSNQIVYTSPNPADMTYDEKTGLVMGTDSTGQPMIMAHKSWLNSRGWAGYPGLVNVETVQSQAQRLIPIAVWGGERLMELFMPLVEVEVSSVDADEETKAPVVTGKLAVREPVAGGYADTASTTLLQNTEQRVLLFIRLTKKEGGTEERVYLAPPANVTGGEVEISLEDCTNADGLHDILFPAQGAKPAYTKVEYGLGLDMGGVLVRSDYFDQGSIAGTWDVDTTIEDVQIPPELMDTSGMSDEEARLWVETMTQAYGGGLAGTSGSGPVEIVANGSDYVLKPQVDPAMASAMAGSGYSMNMPATLTGSTFRAESKLNYGIGSASTVIEAEVSADRKTMDGTFVSKLDLPTGTGSIAVTYKGTWKAVKRE